MIPVVRRDVAEVLVALIDPPEIAMREDLNTPAFLELLESIRLNGIQVPLIVERRGERFRISAGHRRYTAACQLGADTVPCDIREPGYLDAEAIKVLENDDREKVNPAEAANYLARLWLEKCDRDVDKVCALIRKGRAYVESRLSLLEGDAEVLEAVRARRIGLGVANEVNKVVHVGYRRMLLDRALNEGMTEENARKQRREFNRAIEPPPSGAAPAIEQVAPPAPEARNVCRCCLGHDHPERMRWVMVHDYCDQATLDPMLRQWRAATGIGGADAAGE